MGPAFGFLLIGMLAFLILTNITRNSNSVLISRAMKILDDSFSDYIIQDKDISDPYQNSIDDGTISIDSGSPGDLSW